MQNFEQGFEREGAHLTVFHNGKQVVNVWNGFSDSESRRKWTTRTKTVFYSATKAICALCVAMLVDRGRLSYDDLVVKHWPEYGQFGKENTTVEDVLAHKAGIPYIEDVTMDDVADQEQMMHRIETAKPLWKPGTASGYHAITFGWLVDGIVRKVDEKGRDIRTFFREEVAEKYGVDISIGLPKQQFADLARATQPGLLEYARDILADPRLLAVLAMMYLRAPDSIAAKLRMHPSWIPLNYDTVALNDPYVISLNLGAVTGVGNAENFARLFSLALDGTLISNRTLQLIAHPTVDHWHLEQVGLNWCQLLLNCFFTTSHLRHGAYLLGHPGYGGQSLNVDVGRRLVVAYVTNGLKTGSGEMCRPYQRIIHSVFRVIA
ncbi:unnamed protein product [Toxocara canis]|uniref:Beta-lactamase-related domain-containing protein n=1 Tax=Toxocara canis TaxID=6265 RepID=A0A3P7GNX6_TOXCA|nr:unnamed protein product [Toxocara canis]